MPEPIRLPLGLYTPGSTPVHRCPAGAKLAVLAVLGLALALLPGVLPAVAGLAAVTAVAVVAGMPWRDTVASLRAVLLVLLVLGAYQGWQRGWQLGAEVAIDLLTVVLAATVVTATTPTQAMLDTMVGLLGPLRPLGVRPEPVALAAALMLRTVPAMAELLGEVRDAARARGLDRSWRALLVPAAVRTVARARATGEALAARGIGE